MSLNQTTQTQTGSKVMSGAELLAELDALRADKARLEAALAAKPQGGKLSLKVSEKGAVSVYGMGRFPVTLYSGQWQKLFDAVDEIQTFIKTHAAELAVKTAPSGK